MNISARIANSFNEHSVELTTNGNSHSIAIAPRATGFGSSANGGELLLLAIATCYCNDIYREAAKSGIEVASVEVEAAAEFGSEGEHAKSIGYKVRISAKASEEEIQALIRHTDSVAEIHNTIRKGMPVQLITAEAIPIRS